MPHHDVVAVILGGGRGTRLFPLTKLRTKPAVPLAGHYRLIDIPVSNCINSGIKKIFVLTQYMSASLARHVGATYKFDIFTDGFVELLPAEQTLTSERWYQGTADAVRQQMHRIRSRGPREVLILAGDHLYRMDYAAFIRNHRERKADVSVAVLPVPVTDTSRFGVLRMGADGRITDFREKPATPEALAGLESDPGSSRPYLGSMGIYCFRIDVLESLLDQVPQDDFGRHVIPAALANRDVSGWRFDGYWEDIGTIEAFYKANLALTRPDRPFNFYDPRNPIYRLPQFLPASQVDGSTVRRAVISDGCQLFDSEFDECIVGNRTVVRPGCRLHEVVLLGADFYEDAMEKEENARLDRPHVGIGPDAWIERAIVDKNARVGKGVRIRSHEGEPDRDGENWYLRDGVVVVPKNATIPDGTVL
ncbi:MAG: glucose-1-phosphate adenylyltransferase [Deltaproteobacteria bacterium]|nr:glucose-1-phosphate adenylyltransferase [Deltaproteobacteria bacterium]